MASRKTRAQIAQQTVEILERGWYTLPNGTTVSLGDSVRDAVQRSCHYAPGNFADVFARRDQLLAESQNPGPTRFDVVNATTLAAARKLVESRPPGDVVCLNFASAKSTTPVAALIRPLWLFRFARGRQRLPWRGYQVETATNRDANATTSRSNWARASSGLAQSKSWTCQYSTRSTQAGNCSASIRRCSASFKAMIKFARPRSCSVTCTGNRMLPCGESRVLQPPNGMPGNRPDVACLAYNQTAGVCSPRQLVPVGNRVELVLGKPAAIVVAATEKEDGVHLASVTNPPRLAGPRLLAWAAFTA